MSMSEAGQQGSALARALKRSLNMKAGWSETFSWSDEAQQVVDRYDELRVAFERVGAKVPPAFAEDWKQVTQAIAEIDQDRITNTTQARNQAKQKIGRQLYQVQEIERQIKQVEEAPGLLDARLGSQTKEALAPLFAALDHKVQAQLGKDLADVGRKPYPWSSVCDAVGNPDNTAAPTQTLTRLKQALAHVQPNISRAGQVEGSGGGVTVGRDGEGKMVILNQALSFTGVPIAETNKKMSPEVIAQVKQTFTQTVDANYSRHGVALDFMSYVRAKQQEAREADLPPPPLSLLMKTFDAADSDRATKYKGGDCMVLAENLAQRLRDQGLDARVAGYLNSELTTQRVGQDQKFPSDAGVVSCGMTHADVIVPYTTLTDEQRVLVLIPGMGPNDRYQADLSLEDYLKPPHQRQAIEAQMVQQSAQSHMVGPDGGPLDISRMEKEQLHFLTNIQITDSRPATGDKKLCGIDIMAGKIYLNGKASKDFQGLRPKEGSVSLDIKALLAKADELVSMKLPNPDTDTLETVEVTGAEALAIALEGIAQQFDQPEDFVANILTLAENLDAYQSEIVSPDISALHQ